MKHQILILVEGIADIIFLRDFLLFLDPTFKTGKLKDKELILELENKKILLRAIGGYTNILNQKTFIEDYIKINAKVIVIQDTDDKTKHDGGLTNRITYLNNIMNNFETESKTFLFPNHQHDGDLEVLLLQIAKKEKFYVSNECYCKFVECIGKINPDTQTLLIENKNKIFNYFRTYYGIVKAKEEERIYESDYWDFNHEYLDPLLNFIKKEILFYESTI